MDPYRLFWCTALLLFPFIISLILTRILIRLAPRMGLVDQPADRKVHVDATPLGGGLAIYLALLLSTTLFQPHSPLLAFLGIGGILVAVGLIDDVRPVAWPIRLAVHFGTAWLALGGWAQPFDVGSLVALVWVVGLINAFNMLDNMDALSAGVAGIAALSLLLVSTLGAQSSPLPYLMFLGAVAGFLWFNRPPARIFMGDAGSTFLGLFIAVYSLQEVPEQLPRPIGWAVPLCVLAVPWYDLVTVVTVRLAQGRSPFHADKQHLSHRLADRGLPKATAVRIIHGLALASGLAGLLLILLPDWDVFVLAGFGCFWVVVGVLDFAGWRR